MPTSTSEWKVWQKLIGAPQTGKDNKETRLALQKWLTKQKLYSGKIDGEARDSMWSAFGKAKLLGWPTKGTPTTPPVVIPPKPTPEGKVLFDMHSWADYAGGNPPPHKQIADQYGMVNAADILGPDSPFAPSTGELLRMNCLNIKGGRDDHNIYPRNQLKTKEFMKPNNTYFVGVAIVPDPKRNKKWTTEEYNIDYAPMIEEAYAKPFKSTKNGGNIRTNVFNNSILFHHGPNKQLAYTQSMEDYKRIDYVKEIHFSLDPKKGYVRLWISIEGGAWKVAPQKGADKEGRLFYNTIAKGVNDKGDFYSTIKMSFGLNNDKLKSYAIFFAGHRVADKFELASTLGR